MTPTQQQDEIAWLGRFIKLGPAEFRMGADGNDRYATTGEGPARTIRIPHRFAIGVFPVTGEQWNFEDEGMLPKVNVSWHDIRDWLVLARENCGLPLRLPTGIEWEFAARAGSNTGFPIGDTITPAEANFLHDDTREKVGPGHLTPRGTYPPNAFGLEDMLGNVAEWTEEGVVRSSGWDSMPRLLRLSARHPLPPDRRQDNLGFRLAHTLT